MSGRNPKNGMYGIAQSRSQQEQRGEEIQVEQIAFLRWPKWTDFEERHVFGPDFSLSLSIKSGLEYFKTPPPSIHPHLLLSEMNVYVPSMAMTPRWWWFDKWQTCRYCFCGFRSLQNPPLFFCGVVNIFGSSGFSSQKTKVPLFAHWPTTIYNCVICGSNAVLRSAKNRATGDLPPVLAWVFLEGG